MITQDEVRAIFDYCYETGKLTWKLSSKFRKAGDEPKYLHNGYLMVSVNGKNHRVHRICWIYVNGEIPSGYFVDHINHDRADNRIANLRLATISQNSMNRGPNKQKREAKHKGVRRSSGCKNWEAKIVADGKRYWLGNYQTEDEAAHAYNKAAILLHGEFAALNPIGQDKGLQNG